MATANDVIFLAASYIGTHEEPPGSNNVIFNTDYYGSEVHDPSLAWCCAFVWDIFRMANASELFLGGGKTAYCPTVANWAKNTGRVCIYSEAQYGDLVLFDWNHDGVADHIGFVVGLNDDGSLETIEGNTSDSDHSNGGWVLGRRRYPDSVLMIVRIDYPEDERLMIEFEQVQKGDSGKAVKVMQAMLRGRGFIDRKTRKLCAVTGDFDEATERCLIYFQEKKKLNKIDGVCGPETWPKLLYNLPTI